jgi:hypothetical protein
MGGTGNLGLLVSYNRSSARDLVAMLKVEILREPVGAGAEPGRPLDRTTDSI